MYRHRLIGQCLQEWASRKEHKPTLLRGARQVGKSSAARHLGEQFDTYVEINLETQPAYRPLFEEERNANKIVANIAAMRCKTTSS